MSDKNVRRVVGGLSAFAIAAGFAVTAGAGAANAASDSVTWSDGGSKFTRTVSNSTPNEGDIITVTTKFERTKTPVEWIQAVKDLHPTCLTYVGGSPAANEVKPDYARVAGNWDVYPNVDPKSRTFSFQYKVGADCARGTALATGMHYGGSLGAGEYTGKGPSITVNKNATSTTLAPVAEGQVGTQVVLSATVTGGTQGDPVDFYDGGVKLGSGALDSAGKATFSWSPSSKGSHTLQAKFAGTTKATASESAVQNVNVTQANVASTTSLAAVSGAQVGRASALTATVTPAAAGGTVEFKDGSTSLAKVSVDGSGKATYQWTPTTTGSRTIAAEFSGRDGVNGSSTTGTVEVAEKPAANTDSKTEVTAGNGKVGVAQNVSVKVTGAAGGSVTFKVDDKVIGTANVGNDGTGSISWTPASDGQVTITAEYSGAGTVNASSDTVSVVIVKADNGGDGGTDGGDSGTGSLGSLGNIFGSLTGIFGR